MALRDYTDEPVIVFRARDGRLPLVMSLYQEMVRRDEPDSEHLIETGEALMHVENWQAAHMDLVEPDAGSGVEVKDA